MDRKPYHTLMTELHEVAGNRVEAESVQIDLREIFSASRVEVVTDEIKGIDFKGQKLQADSGSYEYDYLIIDTGAEPAFFGIPGVKENGFSLWSFEDAIKIREHIKDMFDKARAEKDQNKRKSMLTFIVAGAGFTGIETMGELLEWKRQLCRDYEIDRKEVSLIVVEAMGSILPILSEGLIKKSERFMQKHGVEIMTAAAITEVNKESIVLKNGREIPTRTLIWTCGIQGSDFAAKTELTHGARGRIQVDEYMQSVEYHNVFAVGDNAYYEEPDAEGKKKSIPQIVEAALQTAETAVHNILASIDKRGKKSLQIQLPWNYGVHRQPLCSSQHRREILIRLFCHGAETPGKHPLPIWSGGLCEDMGLLYARVYACKGEQVDIRRAFGFQVSHLLAGYTQGVPWRNMVYGRCEKDKGGLA
ncbi:MAG: NAD(P)/FAD-dependent oxidoreductase [Clostridia bacterium]